MELRKEELVWNHRKTKAEMIAVVMAVGARVSLIKKWTMGASTPFPETGVSKKELYILTRILLENLSWMNSSMAA